MSVIDFVEYKKSKQQILDTISIKDEIDQCYNVCIIIWEHCNKDDSLNEYLIKRYSLADTDWVFDLNNIKALETYVKIENLSIHSPYTLEQDQKGWVTSFDCLNIKKITQDDPEPFKYQSPEFDTELNARLFSVLLYDTYNTYATHTLLRDKNNGNGQTH